MNQTSTSSQQDRPMRVAVISARWHADIVDRARESFIDEMARHGWPPDRIDLHSVPGAFEIPLKAQQLLRSDKGYSAVVGIAFVVDAGVYRHDFVAAAVVDGLMRVQLDEGVPVFSVVLVPHAFHDHEDHRRFYGDHFVKKGHEAAQCCLGYLQEFAAV